MQRYIEEVTQTETSKYHIDAETPQEAKEDKMQTMNELKDVQFMTAKEKAMVLKQWETFLKGGCQENNFTDRLYKHLINHCSFIAHYDRAGFYTTYFENGEDTARFLSQFDTRSGLPKSIEYGMTYWYIDPDYYDINSEMCRVASKYIPALVDKANTKQRASDIALATALLQKHGISLKS